LEPQLVLEWVPVLVQALGRALEMATRVWLVPPSVQKSVPRSVQKSVPRSVQALGQGLELVLVLANLVWSEPVSVVLGNRWHHML